MTSILKPLVCQQKLLLAQINVTSLSFAQGLIQAVIKAELLYASLIKHHAMNMWGVEVYLRAFVILTLHGSKWSA
jgi:hypothetical protein